MAELFQKGASNLRSRRSKKPSDGSIRAAKSQFAPEKGPFNSLLDQSAMNAPPPPRKLDLASLPDIRREMARLYRDMRSGDVSSNDGSRCAFVLGQIGRLIIEEQKMASDANSAKSYDDYLDEVLENRTRKKGESSAA